MQCIVLSGGLGTRLGPVTATLPKALVPVAGRPFADWQLRWLAASGVTDVVLSIGHLGEAIREFVGNGSLWGLSVTYSDEGPQLRGTAGAIRLASDGGLLENEFMVLYGDSYLRVEIGPFISAFAKERWPALMTVYGNGGEHDRSNVIFRSGAVVKYRKNLDSPPADMTYIDYGLTIMRRQLVEERIPAGSVIDLAAVYEVLSDQGLLGGYEVRERFFEVGSPQGVRELEAFLREGSEPQDVER